MVRIWAFNVCLAGGGSKNDGKLILDPCFTATWLNEGIVYIPLGQI